MNGAQHLFSNPTNSFIRAISIFLPLTILTRSLSETLYSLSLPAGKTFTLVKGFKKFLCSAPIFRLHHFWSIRFPRWYFEFLAIWYFAFKPGIQRVSEFSYLLADLNCSSDSNCEYNKDLKWVVRTRAQIEMWRSGRSRNLLKAWSWREGRLFASEDEPVKWNRSKQECFKLLSVCYRFKIEKNF